MSLIYKKIYKKGFSFIEIIVILAVLAIISVVVFSGFSGLKQKQVLNGAVADIQSVLFRAKNLTLESYEASNYSVLLESGKVAIRKKSDGSVFEEVFLPSGVTLSSGSLAIPSEVSFARLSGDPDQKGNFNINVGNITKSISIE